MRVRHVVVALTALAACPTSADAASSPIVVGVSDGDTVRVRVGRTVRTVNLLGVRAPVGGACFARSSTIGLRSLLPAGTRVRLAGDARQPGSSKYVFKGSGLVNRTMALRGLARAAGSTRLRYAASIRAAQASAQRARRGLWGPACQPVADPNAGAPNSAANRKIFDGLLRNTVIAVRRSGGDSSIGAGFTEDLIYSFCQSGRFVFQRTLVSDAGNEQSRSDGTWRVDSVSEATEDFVGGFVAIDVRDAATGTPEQGTIPIGITGPDTARVGRNGDVYIGRRSSLGGDCP